MLWLYLKEVPKVRIFLIRLTWKDVFSSLKERVNEKASSNSSLLLVYCHCDSDFCFWGFCGPHYSQCNALLSYLQYASSARLTGRELLWKTFYGLMSCFLCSRCSALSAPFPLIFFPSFAMTDHPTPLSPAPTQALGSCWQWVQLGALPVFSSSESSFWSSPQMFWTSYIIKSFFLLRQASMCVRGTHSGTLRLVFFILVLGKPREPFLPSFGLLNSLWSSIVSWLPEVETCFFS